MMVRRGARRPKRWPGGGRFGAWMLQKLSPYAFTLHYPDPELGSTLRGAVLRRARSAVPAPRGEAPLFLAIPTGAPPQGKNTVPPPCAGLITGACSPVLPFPASHPPPLSHSLSP